MKKILITGFSGFVSRHFLSYLAEHKISTNILGLDLAAPDFDCSSFPGLAVNFETLDLLNKSSLERAVRGFRPDYVLHLAAYSSVAYSWQEPAISFANNTNIFLNLAEAVKKAGMPARILSVGSAEEYAKAGPKDLPLTEDSPLNPASPYAVARISQEMLSKIYASHFGLDIVMTRSFNHTGPGQRENFVLSSFARQAAQAKLNGLTQLELRSGNLELIRDFVDARDVVRAYHLLLNKGVNGEIYNVCSGEGRSLREIVEILASLAGLNLIIQTDQSLIRANDYPAIVGSYTKLQAKLGWTPQYVLEQTMSELLDYWIVKLTQANTNLLK